VEGITYLCWEKKSNVKVLSSLDCLNCEITNLLRELVNQLNEYFEGSRKSFTLNLSFKGTVFQQKVWSELLNISYGHTLSYSDIAKAINSPKGVRAVGSANGRNKICILIPCHRVISKQGGLSGFIGGIENKRKLLEIEGHTQFS
jgi:methylated-DNA-[protein]-cysteine S-methyltransferase